MTSPHVRPPWTPPAVLRMEPAGVSWDAIRIPRHLCPDTVRALAGQCGSIVSDPYAGRVTWFVPPDAGADWMSFPEAAGVEFLTVACWVTVPPADRVFPPGPYWAVPYRPGAYLTDPYRLHVAVTAAVHAALGPRDARAPAWFPGCDEHSRAEAVGAGRAKPGLLEPGYCCRCDVFTEHALPVALSGRSSGPGLVRIACLPCARDLASSSFAPEWLRVDLAEAEAQAQRGQARACRVQQSEPGTDGRDDDDATGPL